MQRGFRLAFKAMEDSTVSGCERHDVCSASDVESIQWVNNSKISLVV